MKIFSETGFLIIMDPHYLQLAPKKKINYLKNPKRAAVRLEQQLFPEQCTGKVGLIPLAAGPGHYEFENDKVSFWDVENNRKTNRTIFGVEFASYIIFDIAYIEQLVSIFELSEMEKIGEQAYIEKMNRELNSHESVICWQQSQVGIGDGWHEVSWDAFKKVG